MVNKNKTMYRSDGRREKDLLTLSASKRREVLSYGWKKCWEVKLLQKASALRSVAGMSCFRNRVIIAFLFLLHVTSPQEEERPPPHSLNHTLHFLYQSSLVGISRRYWYNFSESSRYNQFWLVHFLTCRSVSGTTMFSYVLHSYLISTPRDWLVSSSESVHVTRSDEQCWN